ncbi:MAG: hypothetical protein JXJ04_05060 [Spirochaetales bacterium]|nr:hypothetical protein [Spirochaetales bacterium]
MNVQTCSEMSVHRKQLIPVWMKITTYTIGLLGIISTKEWGPKYTIITGFSLLTYFIVRFIISAIKGPIEIRLEPFLISLFLLKIRPINRNWNIKNV